MTSHADTRTFYPEPLGYRLKRLFLGKPYVSEQLRGERLNNPTALGVLAPDCISSSSYGAEQILTQLTPVIGLAAFSLLVPIMYVILGVLILVTLSYLDVIGAYSVMGGSYIVTRDNFGPKTAQITAVALLIDYIVTVAVQCSAGTAALTSAFPSLLPYTLTITVCVILLQIYANLRGLKEAGAFFAFPTYFFATMMTITIVVGFYKHFAGTLPVLPVPSHELLVGGQLGTGGHGFLYGVAFITLLRAYANGGSSLTGLEAISDAVSGFRRPEARNARKVMVVMALLLSFLLVGTTMLATWTHALPYEAGSPTVVSQEVGAVFGAQGFGHVVFLMVQIATVLILYTGGNTAFNGFPFLANFVAIDKYLPRQLTKRGHRLAFSTGIIWLGASALALVIIFDARVNALISLYAIGVFTAFTMAGFGIAIVVGVLLGFVIGSSRVAYAAVYPLMTAFNALPKAAFVPILVVWFGIGIGPAILTAFLISFFPIMVNIATGLATLEPELEDVLRVLGARRWDVLIKVGLPRSMPYFYGSLKVAITLAFVGTTVSEMTAANEGIGYLLISAGSAMQMGLAFAGLVVVGAMAMIMYELFSYVEKHTTAWAHRGSQNG